MPATPAVHGVTGNILPTVSRRSSRASAPVKVPAGKPATTCIPLPSPMPSAVNVTVLPDCAAIQVSVKLRPWKQAILLTWAGPVTSTWAFRIGTSHPGPTAFQLNSSSPDCACRGAIRPRTV